MDGKTISRTGIRKGDMVRVITGRDRGKNGKVLQVLAKKQRVVVEKLNIIKRHTRPQQKNRQGGIVEREGPIQISNVMLLCPQCNKSTRFSVKILTDGKKLRCCRKCGEVLDKG
ncbi:MAG TPA: 50S ribosomal protein L24 [Nitrospiria bacterium]|jgi:large subunit ribosomal protein L24